MATTRRTARPTRSSFTPDFAGSPYRIAYSYADRCHVVVEVATDETVEVEGAQAAYELAAALNYAAATKAALLACPTCGGDGSPCVDCNPVDLAALVPDPETWVAVSEVPCEPVDAEAELDRIDAELSARCACYATGTEQPECLARGTSCDREARRVAWLARQTQMREAARQLGLLHAPVIIPDLHPSPEMPTETYAAVWDARSIALAGIAAALKGGA